MFLGKETTEQVLEEGEGSAKHRERAFEEEGYGAAKVLMHKCI